MTDSTKNKKDPRFKISDESFLQNLLNLKLHYAMFRKLLEIFFGGDFVTPSTSINNKYLQLCIKIEEILDNPDFSTLRKTEWKPFENLLSVDVDAPEADWEYGGRQLCNDFQSKIDEMYIKNGEKVVDIEPSDQLTLVEINTFLDKYTETKQAFDKSTLENMMKNISQYMPPKIFEEHAEIQKNESTHRGKLCTSPEFIIKKFEQFLADLQPLKTKLNGTGELSLIAISKKIRNLLKTSFEDGDKRVKHFNLEGGNFYKNLHSASYRIDNSHALSTQDIKYLENIMWHEMKINEFLDEVNLVNEIQEDHSRKETKEKAYSHEEEYDMYKDLKNIFNSATKEVFIVDAYVDETLFSLYIENIPKKVRVRILTKNPSSAFIQVGTKLGKKRPLEIVDSSSIHDRYIFVDERCWTIGSSLKDAAKSKPTTLVQLGTARDALYQIHEEFWKNGHKCYDASGFKQPKSTAPKGKHLENKHQNNLQLLARKLITVHPYEDRDHTFTLKVKREPEQINKPISTLQDISDLRNETNYEIGWEKVNHLDYLNRFESHLEFSDYKKIKNFWHDLRFDLTSNHNEFVHKLTTVLYNLIKEYFEKNFQSFVNADEANELKSCYYLRNVYKMLWFLLLNYAETNKKPEFNELWTETYGNPIRYNIVTRKHHPYTNDHLLVSAINKDDADIERIKQTLNKIFDNFNVKKFNELLEKRKNIFSVRYKFSEEMKKIVLDIDDGQPIKGECDTCR